MSNNERAQWIDNDESLYNWWRSSRQPKAKFIQENKEEIDKYINSILNRKPND